MLALSSELIFFSANFTNFCLSTKNGTIKATMIKEKITTTVILINLNTI